MSLFVMVSLQSSMNCSTGVYPARVHSHWSTPGCLSVLPIRTENSIPEVVRTLRKTYSAFGLSFLHTQTLYLMYVCSVCVCVCVCVWAGKSIIIESQFIENTSLFSLIFWCHKHIGFRWKSLSRPHPYLKIHNWRSSDISYRETTENIIAVWK